MHSIYPDLAASRIEGPVVSRFAPSPTGYLHLGHVVNAIYVWGVTRALGGQVLLRIEDHDRIRSRPGFECALLEDLDWLGFVADQGRTPLLRQSDSPKVYADALDRLRTSHQVYICDCSRREIGGEQYGGHCRALGLSESPGRSLRVRLDRGLEHVEDLLLGALEQDPHEQCGDVMLRDRDGHWTYQFAVSVDDLRQRVTLVIRGADLVASTGRQIRLARMLGRQTPPRFLHHPLLLGPTGVKLSKSNRDVAVRQLRHCGLTAAEVIGRAAAAVGLLPSPRSIAATEVPDLFRHPRCPRLTRPDTRAPDSESPIGIESKAASRHGSYEEILAVRLFIGNLPYGANEADLRAHFASVAEPSHIVMPVDRETGRPRGFAFVEFTDRAVAEAVIKKFDAQPFQGRTLAVSEARAREDRPPRPPGMSGFAPRPPGGGPGVSGAPRPGGFSSRPGALSGPPPGTGSRDRTANFGPPAPPRRLRGKKGGQQEHRPRGPIKERTGGRIYAVDDLEDDEAIDLDNIATKADEGVEDDQDQEP